MRKTYPDQLLEAYVALLKELRIQKGFSQQKLAEIAGVTRPAISFMESGNRKPSLLLCLKLTQALDQPFSELARDAEKRIPR